MRKLLSCVSACSLLASVTPVQAHAPTSDSPNVIILVGKAQAQHFNAPYNGEFYLQTGSFRSSGNAMNYQSHLSKTTQYPVSIKTRGEFHVVLIGPMHTAAEVREVASTLNGSSNATYSSKMRPARIVPRDSYATYSSKMGPAHVEPRNSHAMYASKMGPVLVNATNNYTPRAKRYSPWVNIEGGYSFSIAPNDVNSVPMPGVTNPDNYNATILGNRWLVGVGGGVQFSLPYTVFPSDRLGLAYNYYSNSVVTGQIDKYETIPTYSYTYNVTTNVFWVDNQLDLKHVGNLVPFIDVAIGAAWNNAKNYQEAPLPGVPTQSVRLLGAALNSNTSTEFAWRVGIGGNLDLTDKLKLGLIYRYTNLGKAITGSSANYPSITGITNRMAGNDAVLSLRYDFDTTGDMK